MHQLKRAQTPLVGGGPASTSQLLPRLNETDVACFSRAVIYYCHSNLKAEVKDNKGSFCQERGNKKNEEIKEEKHTELSGRQTTNLNEIIRSVVTYQLGD